MKYSYNIVDDSSQNRDFSALEVLGMKGDNGRLLIHVDSHKHMADLLCGAAKKCKGIDHRALEAIVKHNRARFFDWSLVPGGVRWKMQTPYAFAAAVFHDGQTIPSPHRVLITASTLDLSAASSILEIGAGSGYNATILAQAAGKDARVYSTEIRPKLCVMARRNIYDAGLFPQARVYRPFDSMLGLPEYGPYDLIITSVGVSGTKQIEQLLDQVRIGGTLRIPIAQKKAGDNEADAAFGATDLWTPGDEISQDSLYKTDASKGFFRAAGFLFRKTGNYSVDYSVPVKRASGPLFEYNRRPDNQKVY